MILAGLVLDGEDGADLLAVRKDGWEVWPRIPKEAPGPPAMPEGTGDGTGGRPPAAAPPTTQGLSTAQPGVPPTGPVGPTGPATPGVGCGAAGTKRPGGAGAGGGIVTAGRCGGGAGACATRAAAVRGAVRAGAVWAGAVRAEAVCDVAVLRLDGARRPPMSSRPAAPAGSAVAGS